jgi:hypothetical protein
MTTETAPAPASNKLSPNTIWLFAFGSIIAGIGVSYATMGLGQKVTAALYFAIVAAGGFLGMYLSSAKMRVAVLAFLLGSVVAAAGYYMLIKHMISATTSIVSDGLGGDHSEGVKVGNALGGFMGLFTAIIVFLETIVAGIGGAFAGWKSRGKSGLAALGSFAKIAK